MFKKLFTALGVDQYMACAKNEPIDGNTYEVPAYEIHKVNKRLCDCGRPVYRQKVENKMSYSTVCQWCYWEREAKP